MLGRAVCLAAILLLGFPADRFVVGAAPVQISSPASQNAAPSNYPLWAFEPLRVTSPPPPREHPGWARTDIDRFILDALTRRGLKPSKPAARRDLIRRLSFNLLGLPPTPEIIERFESDANPHAADAWIDAFLASPYYGERWGRWWLDVARYADTNGQDENKVMANAWRYRDWVVRAFNSNLPFDTFIAHQIAGDLIPSTPADSESESDRADRLIATGFLVLGPKMLAEQDKPKLVLDIIDEQIDTVGRAFLGLTLGCARCHDHKFDPIPARDYYALAGVFKSTQTMENLAFVSKFNERRIAPAREVEVFEAHKKRLSEVTNRLASLRRSTRTNSAAGTKPPTSPSQATPEVSAPVGDTSQLAGSVRSEIASLEREHASLLSSSPPVPSTALAVADGPPVQLPIYLRGNHLTPTPDLVPRGFIEAVSRQHPPPPIPAQQSGRLELARWIASPKNPLTARVIVNRVWQAHFGEGLVRTADNFGARGEPPSHPELLDWLAHRFVQSGWDLKALHRLILSSAVFQQSTPVSISDDDANSSSALAAVPPAGRIPARVDPDNRLLHAFPRRRLDAEMIRDSLLFVSGQLDVTQGGSLVRWKNDEYAPADDVSASSLRRTLYLPVVRDRVYDALTLFDFANPSVATARRTPTVVAHQALFFLNSPLVLNAAAAVARTVSTPVDGQDPANIISDVYRRILGRSPSASETDRARKFLATFPDVGDSPPPHSPVLSRSAEALQSLCQALLASNEFLYRP